jgi:hypothetical protein
MATTLIVVPEIRVWIRYPDSEIASEIMMNRRVHLTMLSVATGRGRRVYNIHSHRHTSGFSLKKPALTRWKFVPGTVDGSSG